MGLGGVMMTRTQKQKASDLQIWLREKGAHAGLRGWAYGMTLRELWNAGCGGRVSARWILDQLCGEGRITRHRAIRLDAKYSRREFCGDDMHGSDDVGVDA